MVADPDLSSALPTPSLTSEEGKMWEGGKKGGRKRRGIHRVSSFQEMSTTGELEDRY